MESVTVNGLVVKSADFGDYDKILTLLTAEKGLVTVTVKGAKSIRCKFSSMSEMFCYGVYNIRRKGKYYYIYDGSVTEEFYPVRNDISKLALASYFCEVATELSPEGISEPDILKLTLNALYALAYNDVSNEIVKASFEFKIASLAGFMPILDGCAVCSKHDGELMFFDTRNGTLLCDKCLSLDGTVNGIDVNSVILRVPSGVLQAYRYISVCPVNRFLSFRISQSEMRDFATTSEKYLINHLERDFQSLKFYKSVANYRL